MMIGSEYDLILALYFSTFRSTAANPSAAFVTACSDRSKSAVPLISFIASKCSLSATCNPELASDEIFPKSVPIVMVFFSIKNKISPVDNITMVNTGAIIIAALVYTDEIKIEDIKIKKLDTAFPAFSESLTTALTNSPLFFFTM